MPAVIALPNVYFNSIGIAHFDISNVAGDNVEYLSVRAYLRIGQIAHVLAGNVGRLDLVRFVIDKNCDVFLMRNMVFLLLAMPLSLLSGSPRVLLRVAKAFVVVLFAFLNLMHPPVFLALMALFTVPS